MRLRDTARRGACRLAHLAAFARVVTGPPGCFVAASAPRPSGTVGAAGGHGGGWGLKRARRRHQWPANEAQKVDAEFLYKSHYAENLDRIAERLEGGEVGGSEVRVRWARRCSAAYGLTPKETRVLELAVMGLTVKGIADQLSMAENTAKTHVRSILAKTGEERLRDLVILAGEDEG